MGPEPATSGQATLAAAWAEPRPPGLRLTRSRRVTGCRCVLMVLHAMATSLRLRYRSARQQQYNRSMNTSSTPKDQLRRVIDEQPDDSSFEEIIKELAFAAMVERGLADVEAGRTISHEEMRRTLESWRK
jgi:predicted transcriptional regulator